MGSTASRLWLYRVTAAGRKEGPAVTILHTVRVKQSAAEGAARRCYSATEGGGIGFPSGVTALHPSSRRSPSASTGSRGQLRAETGLLHPRLCLSVLKYAADTVVKNLSTVVVCGLVVSEG